MGTAPGNAEKILKALGHKPNIAMRCDAPDAVKQAVRNEMSVGILSYDSVKHDLQRGEFKMLSVPGLKLEGKSFIIYRKDRPLSANAKGFLTLLKERRQQCQNR